MPDIVELSEKENTEKDSVVDDSNFEFSEEMIIAAENADVKKGAIVDGTVIKAAKDGIIVDIGYKSEGFVPFAQCSETDPEEIAKNYKKDDVLKLKIISMSSDEGFVVLSKKILDARKNLVEIQELMDSQEVVEVEVKEAVKGGVVVMIKGARGFIPASLIWGRNVDLATLVGTKINAVVVEFDGRGKKLILSNKKAEDASRSEEKKAFLSELTVGDIKDGVVKQIKPFGVFVNIGPVDGLVHVSELSWVKVKSPKDLVSEGDAIKVKVIGIDQESGKISLSSKHTTVDPWTVAGQSYVAGDVVDAKIVRITDFGAFVELEQGIDGLIHISELSYERVEKVEDVVKKGEDVKVKILNVDIENKKISLSKKALDSSEDVPVKYEKQRSSNNRKTRSVEENPDITIGDAISQDILDALGYSK